MDQCNIELQTAPLKAATILTVLRDLSYFIVYTARAQREAVMQPNVDVLRSDGSEIIITTDSEAIEMALDIKSDMGKNVYYVKYL